MLGGCAPCPFSWCFTDPTSCCRWAQQACVGTHKEKSSNLTCLKNSLGLGHLQAGFRCYFSQLSNNINCTETSRLDQEGVSLYHTWELLAGVRQFRSFPHCRAEINSWPPNPKGIWESAKAWNRGGPVCKDERQQAIEWLNDNRPVQRRFIYLQRGKLLLDPLLFRSTNSILYILILFIVSGRKFWTK